jgi:metal-responsive CopG/Arc/MetJ family transcriptional regulator
MQNMIAVGISIDKEILAEIDKERGDVSRSRYLLKMLRAGLLQKNKKPKNKKGLSDLSLVKPVSDKSFGGL